MKDFVGVTTVLDGCERTTYHWCERFSKYDEGEMTSKGLSMAIVEQRMFQF